jgi:hypothetical protein
MHFCRSDCPIPAPLHRYPVVGTINVGPKTLTGDCLRWQASRWQERHPPKPAKLGSVQAVTSELVAASAEFRSVHAT